MGLTLYVDTAAWRAMIDRVRGDFPNLIPVVKGNGYGFGRAFLAEQAAAFGAAEVAVGTVFELGAIAHLPLRATVLTPSLDLDKVEVPESAALTVGSFPQLEHLVRHRPRGPVVLKVMTSVRRHGFDVGDIGVALDALRSAGGVLHSVALHPPLAGSDEQRRAEIETLIDQVPDETPVTLSHLGSDHYARVRERYPKRRFAIRLGSVLWHGDKSMLALRATVIDVHEVRGGERVGYRSVAVPSDGSIVILDAGTSHGVHPLANGDSPFHSSRRRLALVEAPHMHASLAFIPAGEPVPAVGDEVDVQRPLISTAVDRIAWL